MKYSYKRVNYTVLAYDVRTWIHQLEHEELYMPVHLMGKSYPTSTDVIVSGGPALVAKFIAISGGLNTEMGALAKGDLLQYRARDASQTLGLSVGFGRSSSTGTQYEFAAFVRPCVRLDGSTWRLQCDDVAIVWACDIIGSVPYCVLDTGAIAPLMHAAS